MPRPLIFEERRTNQMAANPMELMKLAERYQIFSSQHPKVPAFVKDVTERAIREDAVIEIKVTDPEGKEYVTNMKVTPEDQETFGILKGLLSR